MRRNLTRNAVALQPHGVVGLSGICARPVDTSSQAGWRDHCNGHGEARQEASSTSAMILMWLPMCRLARQPICTPRIPVLSSFVALLLSRLWKQKRKGRSNMNEASFPLIDEAIVAASDELPTDSVSSEPS